MVGTRFSVGHLVQTAQPKSRGVATVTSVHKVTESQHHFQHLNHIRVVSKITFELQYVQYIVVYYRSTDLPQFLAGLKFFAGVENGFDLWLDIVQSVTQCLLEEQRLESLGVARYPGERRRGRMEEEEKEEEMEERRTKRWRRRKR